MSALYLCKNCETLSDEADLREVREDWGIRDPHPAESVQVACPACGSAEIVERALCTTCITDLGEDVLDGRCKPCFRTEMGDAEGLAPDSEAMTAWVTLLRQGLTSL